MGSSEGSSAIVAFEPDDCQVRAKVGQSILEKALEAGIIIRAECGGRLGFCGKCKVIVEDQSCLNKPSTSEVKHLASEELKAGYRLACQATVKGSTIVRIPEASRMRTRRIQTMGVEREMISEPPVRKYSVNISEATLHDPRDDAARLTDALEEEYGLDDLEIEYQTLRTLPDTLRDSNWRVSCTVWNEQKVLSVEPSDTCKAVFGFAVDVGTSKIVVHLVDLRTGKTLDADSMENPQLPYGADVLGRVGFAMEKKENLLKLQTLVLGGINTLVSKLCKKNDVKTENCYELVPVGNTIMMHLLLGIQPKYIALSPFTAGYKRSMNIKARDLRVAINAGGNVHIPANIAGYVGADAVASVLATGVWERDEMSLLIDIGTNTEILVGNKEGIVACSAASGPAFEGAHIENGVKAVTGAIEKVRISASTLEYEVIGGGKPIGICGSGVLDAISELYRNSFLDHAGTFVGGGHERLRRMDGRTEFILAWRQESGTGQDLALTQHDVRQVQLAKAAIYSGCILAMAERRVRPEDLSEVLVAGAFGNFMDPLSAMRIGLVPEVPRERIRFVGNTAIVGAKVCLLSKTLRRAADALVDKVKYLELSSDPRFRKEFLGSMNFPELRDTA